MVKPIFKYAWIVLRHKWFVFLAGRKTVPWWRLLVHDFSKFGRAEFGPYMRRYAQGRAGKMDHTDDDMEWHVAWGHHWKRNPHHWEHWLRFVWDPWKRQLLPEPIEMPYTYVMEMIADWKGAGRAYNGSWDISQWYFRNAERMVLHPATRVEVEQQLFNTLDDFPLEDAA